MKNRRSLVLVFLLVACAFLGIGYAALSTNASIKGTLNYQGNNSVFDGYIIVESLELDTENTNLALVKNLITKTDVFTSGGTGTDAANFKLNYLSTIGDKAVIKATIKNTTDTGVQGLNAALAIREYADQQGTHTKITVAFEGDDQDPTVAPNDNIVVLITIEVTETVVDDTATKDIMLYIDATALDPVASPVE